MYRGPLEQSGGPFCWVAGVSDPLYFRTMKSVRLKKAVLVTVPAATVACVVVLLGLLAPPPHSHSLPWSADDAHHAVEGALLPGGCESLMPIAGGLFTLLLAATAYLCYRRSPSEPTEFSRPAGIPASYAGSIRYAGPPNRPRGVGDTKGPGRMRSAKPGGR